LFSAAPAPVRPVLPSRDFTLAALGENSFLQSAVVVVHPWLRGLRDLCERGESAPDGPDDAGHLVGHSDGGFVVYVSLRELVRPFSKAIWLLGAGLQEDGAGTADEEGAQVAVAALGDAAKIALQSAG
jgi:hypothetical protein